MEELTLEKALEYLKEGIILRLIDNKFTLVKLNKNKVLINNQNSNIILNLEQFKELYKDNKFIIYENKETETIDEIKDQEYYNWNHK